MAEDGASQRGASNSPLKVKSAVPYMRLSEVTPLVRAVLTTLLAVQLVLYFSTSIHEPRFFWHLSLGSWILKEKLLPVVNHFTFVGEYLDCYSLSWLFDTVVAVLFNEYGFFGVGLLKILLIAVFLGGVIRLYYAYSHSKFCTAILVTMVFAGVLVRSQLTPDLFAYIFLSLVCDWIFFVRSGRATRGFLIAILPLSIFAANMNLLAVLGCSALVCLSVIIHIGEQGVKSQAAQQTVMLFLLMLLGALLTPYFGGDLLFGLHTILSYLIVEVFRGQDIGLVTDYAVGLILLLVVAMGIVSHKDKSAVSHLEMLLFAAILVFSIIAKTLAPALLIITGFLVANILGRGVENLGNLGRALIVFEKKLLKLPAFACLFFVSSLIAVSASNVVTKPYSGLLLPQRELDFLFEQERWRGYLPLYHTADLGGYVLWRMQQRGVSRASAASALSLAYPKLGLLEQSTSRREPGWDKYFYSILSPRSALVIPNTKLAEFLSSNPRWCSVDAPNWDWLLFLKLEECPKLSDKLLGIAS